MTKDYHLETLAIHAGQEPDPTNGAIMTPIYQTSTYVLPDIGQDRGYDYGRSGNPTRTALQENLAALEGGRYGLAFASGLAATDIVMRLIRPGDHVVVGDDVYGGVYRMFDKILKHYGLSFSFVDLSDLAAFEAALQPNTKLIWLETPTNPQLKLADIAAISQVAKARNILTAVDNTFASPYLQQPLALGADIVVHSTTKYLGGHSDIIGGGLVLNDEAVYEQLKFFQNAIGSVPGPMDCWLVLRGIKTLPLRVERHCQNALALAQWLSDHPAVAQVHYPGLPSHPQHELAKRQMKGFGGMISITLHGGAEAARRMVKRTKLFALALSLGGVESLIEIPHALTHASTADSEIAVDPALIRLSVGVEHVDDLRADLAEALG